MTAMQPHAAALTAGWLVLGFLAAAVFGQSGGTPAYDPAAYVLEDDYNVQNFFNMFQFDNVSTHSSCRSVVSDDRQAPDPTFGHVQYVNRSIAQSHNLTSVNGKSVIIKPDITGVYPNGGPGRPSVRLVSNRTYTHGLFVLKASHMPWGCGVWPAFWTLGPDWPSHGEIGTLAAVASLNSAFFLTNNRYHRRLQRCQSEHHDSSYRLYLHD